MPVHEPSTVTSNSLIWFEKRDNEDHSDDDLDNDECEEWERHEALNDDVTTHERTKQALFEDEMEVVWEKGGPGIVWHMDANVFKAQNGGDDLDEANDDWYVHTKWVSLFLELTLFLGTSIWHCITVMNQKVRGTKMPEIPCK